MSRSASPGIGLRLAVGRDRDARVRLAVTALGVAIGVAVILGGLGAERAKQARDDRATARAGSPQAFPVSPSDRLVMQRTVDAVGDRAFTRIQVSPVGDAPVPPGLPRVPDPGELFVSPEMRNILEGASGSLLTPRVPGRIVGEIAPPGLLDPTELLVYVGVPLDQLRRADARDAADVVSTSRFGLPPTGSLPLDAQEIALRQTMAGVVIGLMVPVLVLIWTATRLSAARREERLAILRLVGGTPNQVRSIAAVEAAVGAALGSVLGVAVFLVARWFLPWILPPDARFFPSDLAPPVWAASLVVIATPMFAVGVAWLALGRVISSPLRVARRSGRRPRIVLPAIVLAVGLGLWIAGVPLNDTIERGHWGDGWYLSAWVSTSLGILLVSPWVGTRGASSLARLSRGAGAWLGARRLSYDGRAANRVTAGVVAVTFAASVAAGLLVIVEGGGGGLFGPSDLLASTVVIEGVDDASEIGGLAVVPGVGSVSAIRTTYLHNSGVVEVLVVDCAEFSDLAHKGCARGSISITTASRAWRSLGGRELVVVGTNGRPIHTGVVLPDDPARDRPRPPTECRRPRPRVDASLISPEILGGIPRRLLLVGTDGTPAALEGIRNQLAGEGSQAVARSAADAASQDRNALSAVRLVIQLGTIVGLSIAAASMLISTVGAVQERRKPLAALAATGAPPGSCAARSPSRRWRH